MNTYKQYLRKAHFIMYKFQLIFFCSFFTIQTFAISKVVYGKKNIVETRHRAVAAMVASYKISLAPNGHDYNLKYQTLNDYENLCSGELYEHQQAAARCSGALISDDLILTAAHCINAEADCADNLWLFDYYEGNDNVNIKKERVFRCKEIIYKEFNSVTGMDYVVIRLDRSTNRTPLNIESIRAINADDKLAALGFPSGVPMKRTDAGSVYAISPELPYIVANLDTFGGNSGSPVFDQNSGELLGLLVRGAKDYNISEVSGDNDCRRVNYCESIIPSSARCFGEHIIKLDHTKVKQIARGEFVISANQRLLLAAKSGDYVAVEKAIASGANPNTQDSNGDTPLLVALKNNQLLLVNYFISDERYDLNFRNSENKNVLEVFIDRLKEFSYYENYFKELLLQPRLNLESTNTLQQTAISYARSIDSVLAHNLLLQFFKVAIANCKVTFTIEDRAHSAFYNIYSDDGVIYAQYQSPFGTMSTIVTTNIKTIEYDYALVQQYFIGDYKKHLARIGKFNGDDVFNITQYGIEMNGNSASAQLLLFYNSSHELMAKVVYPSYFPMLCQ